MSACHLLAAMAILGAVKLMADELPPPHGWPAPDPLPSMPGPSYQPPIDPNASVSPDAPRICQHSADAGPDETFFLVGSGISERAFVWGRSAADAGGQRWVTKNQLVGTDHLAATVPDRAADGLYLAWLANDAGWSRPFRLNAPQAWWCQPRKATGGSTIRIFGRDLARRPDRSIAFVYLAPEGQAGRWLEVEQAGKYDLRVRLPGDTEPGQHRLWVHAGMGGPYGWSEPLDITVSPNVAEDEPPSTVLEAPAFASSPLDLQVALDRLEARGGGVLKLGKGTFPYQGTLRVPARVTVQGLSRDATRLQIVHSPSASFPRFGSGWSRGPQGVHTRGDTMEYRVKIPADGDWVVWLRYATEMSKWGQPGVSSDMTLSVDDGEPVSLENLPNTGSFTTFRWSRAAVIRLTAGDHRLTWRNEKGGGINLDAYVFTRDEAFTPSDKPFPGSSERVVVLQGEDVVRFKSKDGRLPGGVQAAVWLSGDDASLRDLAVSGSPQTKVGIVIRSRDALRWTAGCQVERVKVVDIEGKMGDNCGVLLEKAEDAVVRENELWARAPIFMRGVRRCDLSANRLVPVTRFGANALAAILGRTDIIEECVIEGNRVACPPGAEAGGPTVMRMIWVSTGRGSVTHNWMADNGVEPAAGSRANQARFGAVAGYDQNVGEMILLEANHRIMFFGSLDAADRQSVTLPGTLDPTPDDHLKSVKREQLAHDEEGRETPFWPPDVEDGGPEPAIGEYYVTVFKGHGWGQTRRVVRREGTRLHLDRPWRELPSRGSVVVIATAYYQNHIIGNHTADGMTGVQLWISCIENVVAGNAIARQRKEGIFLFGNGTTLASSMPRTWNRGISPLFFNHIESNRTDECKAGVLVTSGDYPGLPIEFPRALGNVVRHNSFIRNRIQGVNIHSRGGDEGDHPAPSVFGTLCEFNVVRDAPIAYSVGGGADGVVLRRDHAYFWYPVNNSDEPPIAFRIDRPHARVVIDENTVEGIAGTHDRGIVDVQRADE